MTLSLGIYPSTILITGKDMPKLHFGDLIRTHFTNKGLPGPASHHLPEHASFLGILSGNGRADKSHLWWNILLWNAVMFG